MDGSDARLASVVELLGELVAIPTVAGRPNEQLIDLVGRRLAACGIDSATVASATRADGLNLHATVGPPVSGGLLLAAHTDVVDVEGQTWSSDPFTLRCAGDALYGRGTTDMKGFLAAAVCAVERAATQPLRRPLTLALSCDEELGCAGVGTLLDALSATQRRPALGIVGEPTGMRVADRHKGKVRLRVDVRGRAVHSAIAPAGVNAVVYAARVVTGLDEIGGGLADTERDAAFAVPHATLSVGPIHGGVSTNIVPEQCTFEFELRLMPGQDGNAVLGRVRALSAALEREMQVVASESVIKLTELARYPGLRADLKAPSLPGAGETIAVDFGTEAGLYHERLSVPVVVYGPGDMGRAHRPDEYIRVSELRSAVSTLDALINGLCRPATQ
ncbi:MAG TPA: acetylornithine deacetylase [Solirubrobacteraceae bacterium]|jgi:acetylornithine deacetylase|nr:acetylornithine deacetylase [Solirubrobacteraceae bacterium]